MYTEVFILDHNPFCLFQCLGNKHRLITIPAWCLQLAKQVHLLGIGGHRQALGWAYIDTGIAFNAQIVQKYRLDVTVEAAFGLGLNLLCCKTQLNFRGQVFETL